MRAALLSLGRDGVAALVDAMVAKLIADHSIWISGSHWHGQKILRISVSNWSTSAEDCAVTIDAVRRATQ